MAQDHPCVIELIRRHFLDAPSPSDAPYRLENPKSILTDLSHGQVPVVLDLLHNKVRLALLRRTR